MSQYLRQGGTPPANSVTTAMLQDDAVSLAKIASGTDGELITWDASGNPTTVGAGTSGHFLKSQGAGSVPVFAAISASGYELLSATTCSGTASVALESMESGYHYRLIAESLVPASDNQDIYVRVGTSGPSYSTSGYQYVVGGYLGTSGTKEASTSAGQFRVIGQGGGTSTGEQYFVDINILNPALSTARTHLYGNVGGKAQDGNMIEQNFVGFRSTAEANTAVKIYFASANIASGKVYFYRIANA
tara:strand:+ start:6672 stop:7409 length:738 start_codon:yes stop_codon:yes gene_type:complete